MKRLFIIIVMVFYGLLRMNAAVFSDEKVDVTNEEEQAKSSIRSMPWAEAMSESAMDKLEEVLGRSAGNREQIEKALNMCSNEESGDMVTVVTELRTLDLLDVSAEQLMHVVREARLVRGFYPDIKFDDVIYHEGLLEPFISPYEHLRNWRKFLRGRFENLREEEIQKTVDNVVVWLRDNFNVRNLKCYFGPLQDPGSLVRTGWGSEYQRDILCVAMLRSLGVPSLLSRIEPGAVDFHNGQEWRTIKISSGMEKTTDDQEAAEKEPGSILVELKLRGIPVKNTHSFGFSQWKGGAWKPLDTRDFPMQIEKEDENYRVSLPKGQYLFTAGTRNFKGDPYIHTRIIDVEPGSEQTVSMNLDMPFSERKGSDRYARKLDKIPGVTLSVKDTGDFSLNGLLKENHVMLVFYDPGEEPSARMMPLIFEMKDELKQAGAVSFMIRCGTVESEWEKTPFHEVEDARGEIAAAFNLKRNDDGSIKNLPSVVLMKKGGEFHFWTEGYNLSVASLLRDALDDLKD